MKGKNFLKVTGILMIIGGAISAIVGLIALIGTLAVSSLLTGSGLLGWMIIGSVLCLISGVAELIAGIFGVSHCEKPEKAHTCILWGCIVVGLCVLDINSSPRSNLIAAALNLSSSSKRSTTV